MRFILDDYKGDYVMHCKTAEEAKAFTEFLSKAGRKWCNGEPYIGCPEWLAYEKRNLLLIQQGAV